MPRVIHKREVEWLGTFANISWNKCGAKLGENNRDSHEWKEVTCKLCLKLKGRKNGKDKNKWNSNG